MKKNSYPRFIQSEQYRNLLQNAPNPVQKKAYEEFISIKYKYLSLFFLVEYFILSKIIIFVHHRVVVRMNMILMMHLVKMIMH